MRALQIDLAEFVPFLFRGDAHTGRSFHSLHDNLSSALRFAYHSDRNASYPAGIFVQFLLVLHLRWNCRK